LLVGFDNDEFNLQIELMDTQNMRETQVSLQHKADLEASGE